MTGEAFFEKMELIDDTYVEECRSFARPRRWIGLVAACLVFALLLGSGFLIQYLWRGNDGPYPNDSPFPEVTFLEYKEPLTGTPAKSIGRIPGSAGTPPAFGFFGGIVVTAKAVQVLPETYETLCGINTSITAKYRIFKMRVIDQLSSGISGEFWYALPEYLYCDLMQYDCLLLGMEQLGNEYLLVNLEENQTVAFASLFAGVSSPELGSMIAFTDDVFDESLWAQEHWLYGYQFARYMLDTEDSSLLVHRGITLSETLARLEDDCITCNQALWLSDIPGAEAQQALEYVRSADKGFFQCELQNGVHHFIRYIGGCATSERILIYPDGTVQWPSYRFEEGDFDRLPDVAGLVEKLELEQLEPPNLNVEGLERSYCGARGSYHKIADGVVAMVVVEWMYISEHHFDGACDVDYMVLRLTEDGVQVMTVAESEELLYGRSILKNR